MFPKSLSTSLLTSYNPFRQLVKRNQNIVWVTVWVLMRSTSALKYVSLSYIDYPDEIEPYFNRLQPIFLIGNSTGRLNHDHLLISPAIFINENHLLTSYNPYRQLVKRKNVLDILRISVYTQFIWHHNPEHSGVNMYESIRREIRCARPVHPVKNTDEQWLGKDIWLHSPVHDLFVIRVDPIELKDPKNIFNVKDLYKTYFEGTRTETIGPLKTIIAKPGDELGKNFTIGGISFDHVSLWDNYAISAISFGPEDDPIEDCTEWLPKEWGHFICVKNIHKWPLMGSGSILVHNEMVFGIGSFVLHRMNSSVVVFTDLRVYHHLIFHTCVPEEDEKMYKGQGGPWFS